MPFTHLNELQIATMLRLAKDKPRDHALLSMSAYTALRISDILSLNIANVLDDYGRIRQRLVIRQKKTGRPLELSLPEPLRTSLRRYLDARAETDRAEPLFINFDRDRWTTRKRGTARLTPDGAHKLFKKYLAWALGVSQKELKGLSTHVFRKSLAMMIYKEKGLRAAQALLGHHSIGSTGVYLDKLMAAAEADEFRNQLDFSLEAKTVARSSKSK